MRNRRGRVGTWALAAFLATGSPTGLAADGAVRTFEITASRFKFEPSLIAVERGETVNLVLRSADTDHGLAISAYRVKVAIPKGGAAVGVSFVARQAGRFTIECSEYCGSGHKRMKAELVVREEGK